MAEIFKSVTDLMKTARGNKALGQCLCDIVDFQEIIDDIPTADVQEVKHSRWLSHGIATKCSLCGKWLVIEQCNEELNYCPFCGAKMDGVKNE